MSLKRQYRMENGRLKYYVDTQRNIDDGILLDLLSQATSRHMRQVVSTIQAEQSAAIRYENARVISVVGGAGSGKTSIAMHRAAFLMYRQRDTLDARRIQILSPGSAFRSTYPPCCPIWEKRTYARARCGRSSKTSSARRSNRRSSKRKSCSNSPTRCA